MDLAETHRVPDTETCGSTGPSSAIVVIYIEVLQSKKPAGEIQEMLIRAALSQMPMNAVSRYDNLLAHVEELLEDLLSRRMIKDKEIVSSVAQKLTSGYKFHGRVFISTRRGR